MKLTLDAGTLHLANKEFNGWAYADRESLGKSDIALVMSGTFLWVNPAYPSRCFIVTKLSRYGDYHVFTLDGEYIMSVNQARRLYDVLYGIASTMEYYAKRD